MEFGEVDALKAEYMITFLLEAPRAEMVLIVGELPLPDAAWKKLMKLAWEVDVFLKILVWLPSGKHTWIANWREENFARQPKLAAGPSAQYLERQLVYVEEHSRVVH